MSDVADMTRACMVAALAAGILAVGCSTSGPSTDDRPTEITAEAQTVRLRIEGMT